MSLAHLFWASFLSLSLSSFGTVAAYAEPQPSNMDSEDQTPSMTSSIEYENIPQLFQEAYSYESGNFFDNNSLRGRLKVIFGVAKPLGRSSFPENEISRDAKLLNLIYQDYMQQYSGGDPIRTRDLENPYSTSVGSPESFR